MIFGTTNNISKLDPALLRPGRLGNKVAFTWADPAQTQAMYRLYRPSSTDEEVKFFLEITRDKNFTVRLKLVMRIY
jgi:ATP-dependent 26S proteasome regulatory subunit